MTETSPYKDLRTDFFRSYFENALPYDRYLEVSDEGHAAKWAALAPKIQLTDGQIARLQSFVRKMPVLILSGVWCGDCVRQGPMLRAIEQNANVFDMRYIDNRENPELQDELRINGASKVPVVVTFSEDFYELSRFGDRHLSVYNRKLETELGAACDPGLIAPGDELAIELEEWVRHFERLHAIIRLAPMLRKRHGD